MIIRKADAKKFETANCHGGEGLIRFTEMFADYKKKTPGFKFLHYLEVEPGASVGEHTHQGDEEVYVILEGRGVMLVDGEKVEVGPGDACLTRSGHSHALTNTGGTAMSLVVVAAGL